MLAVGAALGAETAGALLINNGLDPSDPANLITTSSFESLTVRNLGCGFADHPCAIPRAPTIVEIRQSGSSPGGTVANVDVWDSSELRIDGGRVEPNPFVVSGGSILAHDQSRVSMTRGTVAQHWRVFDFARATIAGGTVDTTADVSGRGQLRIDGGTLRGPLVARGLAMITFAGGVQQQRVEAFDSSRILVTGGRIIGDLQSFRGVRAFDESVIEIVGSGFAVNGVAVPFGVLAANAGRLTGTFLSGQPIDLSFGHADALAPPTNSRVFGGTIVVSASPTPLPDADGDGVPDRFDRCVELPDPAQADRDLDGLGDACNDAVDPDGDDYADGRDTCPDLANPAQEDTDGNGVGDACNDSIDPDGDEFEDGIDACPDRFDPGQEDGDADGRGDACDLFPGDRFNLEGQVRG